MENISRRQLLLLAVLFEAGLGVLACLAGFFSDQQPWDRLHWNADGLFWGVGASLPMLALFYICLRYPLGPIASIRKITDQIIRPLFRPCTLLDLLVISLLAGLGEELLFRGLLQDLFAEHLETWAAVLLAGVLFGLLHPITPVYAVLASFMGIYLGFVYLAAGNLLAAIVAHGFYDFVALVYLAHVPAQSDSPTVSVNGKSG
jgi:membrane protease YdiL (CAAX protease family)